MSVYADKKIIYEEFEDRVEVVETITADIVDENGEPPTTVMEQEKRIRREIANSNERRRMQSINNGFKSLRMLLPHHEGEKLSKAAILQQTAEYIYSLEQEKTLLLSQNCHLKRLVHQHEGGELPPKKRKTEVAILSAISEDEGLGSMSPEMNSVVNTSDTITELRRSLERERSLRVAAEEQSRQLEEQIYQQQVYNVEVEDAEVELQIVGVDSVPPVGHTQTVVCSPINSRSSSPTPASPEQRLPSVLEAAIKAEPKVEVERLPSPNAPAQEDGQTRVYVSNTSRQNLETIVEAIRHLEGDHLFGDDPLQQEVPLALTTRTSTATLSTGETIKIELAEQYEIHTPASIQHHQQSRPGVIVGKQTSS